MDENIENKIEGTDVDTAENLVEETAGEVAEEITEAVSEDTMEEQVDENEVVSAQKASPLPIYGKGAYFVIMLLALTVLAVILGHIGAFKSGIPSAKWLRYTYIFLGFVAAFFGSSMYLSAINEEEMIFNLRMGNLITTGIYSKTRNPVYGGMILISTAVLFFSGNAYMYILPFIEAFVLFVWIAPYEDRMLRDRFGEEYDKYKKSTHFLLPTKKTD